MNNKNLLENKIETFKHISQNVVTFPKNNIFSQLIKKSIEIVTVPKPEDSNSNQANVGIVLDEILIFKILSEHYTEVLITEIKTKKDLAKLALRKPDLVFSGVKYFHFDNKKVWLNDYLELNDIFYIASNKSSLLKESNKSRAKKIIKKSNIPTADFFTTEPGEHKNKKTTVIRVTSKRKGKHERVHVEHVHRAAIHHMERQAAGRGSHGCESRAGKHHVLRQR